MVDANLNIGTKFELLRSIASSDPTDTTTLFPTDERDAEGNPILAPRQAGWDGKPTQAEIDTAQTALDAVQSAFVTVNKAVA